MAYPEVGAFRGGQLVAEEKPAAVAAKARWFDVIVDPLNSGPCHSAPPAREPFVFSVWDIDSLSAVRQGLRLAKMLAGQTVKEFAGRILPAAGG